MQRLAPNPATRILLLVLLALCQPVLATPARLAVLVLLASAILLAGGTALLGRTLRGLARLRWLLASILGLYLFVDPAGAGLRWPGPSEVVAALGRLLPLVIVLAGATLLLATTGVERLSAGLHTCLRPLGWLGLPARRFARLLALTLHAIPVLAERLEGLGRSLGRGGMSGLATAGADLVRDAEAGGPVRAAQPPEPEPFRASDILLLLAGIALVAATAALWPGP